MAQVGLDYICATAERFFAVSAVLNNMVQVLPENPSVRLLKHIIRCYMRLSDNARAREALRQCLPSLLMDPGFTSCLKDDIQTRGSVFTAINTAALLSDNLQSSTQACYSASNAKTLSRRWKGLLPESSHQHTQALCSRWQVLLPESSMISRYLTRIVLDCRAWKVNSIMVYIMRMVFPACSSKSWGETFTQGELQFQVWLCNVGGWHSCW